MHYAGQLRRVLEDDAPAYGYRLEGSTDADAGDTEDDAAVGGRRVRHDWKALVASVQRHIKSLNFGYRSSLVSAGVKYHNARGALGGGHEIALTDGKGRTTRVTARHIVLATGGRPRVPAAFEGAADLAITSDDLFSLADAPGKTLVVGGGYVALECAGVLASLGYEVTVLIRSVPLRGFDVECSRLAAASVAEHGATLIEGATPLAARRDPGTGRIVVSWTEVAESAAAGGSTETLATASKERTTRSDEFDTLLVATGRVPEVDALQLDRVGLQPTAEGKLRTTHETTAVRHIHAVGDVASEHPHERPELTPVAAKAGVLLARRLCAARRANEPILDSNADADATDAAADAAAAEEEDDDDDGGGVFADMVARDGLRPDGVATAVFTPLEYACVGLSEEDARDQLGDERLQVYHRKFAPLEWSPVGARSAEGCFIKVLCDLHDDERVVGMHIVGDHAGEITQGFALAVRMGCTKAELDATIGIHPTVAEEMVRVSVTKRSGSEAAAAGC